MNRTPTFETPWVFILTIVVIWVALWSTFEVFFFDGDLFSAVIQGTAGGLVFGIAFYYLGQRD